MTEYVIMDFFMIYTIRQYIGMGFYMGDWYYRRCTTGVPRFYDAYYYGPYCLPCHSGYGLGPWGLGGYGWWW